MKPAICDLQFASNVTLTSANDDYSNGVATITFPLAGGLGTTIERAIALAQSQIDAALAGADSVAIDAWHEVHEQLSQALIAVTRAKKVRAFATADVVIETRIL